MKLKKDVKTIIVAELKDRPLTTEAKEDIKKLLLNTNAFLEASQLFKLVELYT